MSWQYLLKVQNNLNIQVRLKSWWWCGDELLQVWLFLVSDGQKLSWLPISPASWCSCPCEIAPLWVWAKPVTYFSQASVCSSVFVSSQQRFGVMDIKAPPRHVTALGSWADRVIALRSRTDHVIALREISVTALFYLDNSRKIHLWGVRACWPEDTKRRAPQRAGERERERKSSWAHTRVGERAKRLFL